MPRRSQLAAVAVVAAVAAACGGDAVDVPELTAEPLPPSPEPNPQPPDGSLPPTDGAGDPPEPLVTPDPDDPDDPGEREDPTGPTEPAEPDAAPLDEPVDEPVDDAPPTGPSDRDVGAFLTGLVTDAADTDHVVGDVTGDGLRDLLLAALEPDGHLAVVVATWQDDEFHVVGELARDGVDRLGRTALKDVDDDGRREVLVPYRSGPRVAVLVATVADDGALALPGACPLPEPATLAIRLDAGSYEPELACSRRDTTGPAVLVWEDGVFQGPSGPLGTPGG